VLSLLKTSSVARSRPACGNPCLGCASRVAIVQSADHRDGDDLAPIRRVPLAELRGILVEREVGPGAVIALEVSQEDAPQVPLSEDDDVVEAFPAKSPDHALAVTYRTRNVAVGTTKKSMATRSWAWFRRNVRQFCDGGFRRRGMYRDTVASETLKPRMSNSP
jgi:hypothetical protein